MTRLQAMRAIWQSPISFLADLYGTHDIRDIDSISWEWVKWLDKEGSEFVSYDLTNWWHIYTRETTDDKEVDLDNTDLNNPNKLPF